MPIASVPESELYYEPHRTGPHLPLEIKDMIIDQLATADSDLDLRTMMYVWPESLRTIRKHRFAYVKLDFDSNLRDSKTSMKRVARFFTLLQNSPSIGDCVTELVLWDDDDRGIFPLSRISYVPGMLTNLKNVRCLLLKELSFVPKAMPNFPTFVHALAGYEHLDSLELHQCAFDFLDLVALLNAVPSLKELYVGNLRVRHCSVVGARVVQSEDASTLSDFEGGPILSFAPRPGTPRLATTMLHLDKVVFSTVNNIGDHILWDFLWSSGLIGSLRELQMLYCDSMVTHRMHNMIECTRSSLQSLRLGAMSAVTGEGHPMDLAHLRKLRFEMIVTEWQLHDSGDRKIQDWYMRSFRNLPSHTLLEELTVDVWIFLEDGNYSEPLEPEDFDIDLWRELDDVFVGPQMGLQKLTFVVTAAVAGSDIPREVARQNMASWLLDDCLPRTREHFFAENSNNGRVGVVKFTFPAMQEEDESPGVETMLQAFRL